jgi:type I restriction enzyme M protein
LVTEQITCLLFIKRLDDLQTLEEAKTARLKKPLEHLDFPAGVAISRKAPFPRRRHFPEGKDKKKRSYAGYRWPRFTAEMYTVVAEHV